MNLDFLTCPNCNGPWTNKPRPKCPGCDLFLFKTVDPQNSNALCVYTYLVHYEVWWRQDGSISIYPGGDMNKHILLPTDITIPYDITNDQLQLFLTFS